jgi:predicted lipid-binding transport protein (Tim44 family)
VRGGSKTLVVALAALLIAVGLVACGGSDSSSSTTTEAGQGQAESKSSQGTPKQSEAKGDEGKSGSGGGGQATGSGPSASDFTPKHHSDSGGGSAQYKVKGGDNSVQEYGEEADSSEFVAAATALHNFLDARAEGNWEATCSYVSKTITESLEKLAAQAKQLEDKSCATLLKALTNPAAKASLKAEAEQANVRSLRTEGERAFVIYTGTDNTILAMPMANEDGNWKVSSLAGTPLN